MWKRGAVWWSVLLTAVGISCALSTRVGAATPNIWAPTSNPTLTPTSQSESASFSSCTSATVKVSWFFNPAFNSRDVEGCFYETPYGSISEDGGYIRFNAQSVYRQVDAWYVLVRGIPNSNKALAYFPSSQRLGIYSDVRKSFDLYNNNGAYYLRPKQPVRHQLIKNPYTGGDIYVRATGVSSNGKWLVIETGGGFVRYEMSTGKMLSVGKGFVQYGGGSDPGYDFSITDDGRYIKVSGNNVLPKVIDAASCATADASNPVGVYATCETLDLFAKIQSVKPNTYRTWVSSFRSGGRELFVDAWDGAGKHAYYLVRAEGQLATGGYIALGDSYSSGEGDEDQYYLPGTNGTPEYPKEKCHNSKRSYPYLLNTVNSGGVFYSFACSGATSIDIKGLPRDAISEQYYGNFNQLKAISQLKVGSVIEEAVEQNIRGRAPQGRHIDKYQPQSITLTIGGNDIGFGSMLEDCIRSTFSNSTCSWATDAKASKGRGIQSVYSKLKSTYQDLQKKSPHSTLYVLSYPQFMSEKNECAMNIQLDSEERRFIRESIKYLNQVIRQAALSTGAVYIDIEDSLKGLELCASKKNLPINGITYGDDQVETQFGNIIGNESFHPNAWGHQLITSYITKQYGSLPSLIGERCSGDCSSYSAPAVPAYFGATASTPIATKEDFVLDLAGDIVRTAKAGQRLAMRLWTSQPNTSVTLWLHSDPVNLGTYKTDADGFIDTEVVLPAGTPPGAHNLHVYTTNGEPMDYYQPILVVASDTDYDGDGIPNDRDQCGFIVPSGIDEDGDGVDDACDGSIAQTETEPGFLEGDQASALNPGSNGVTAATEQLILGVSMNDASLFVGVPVPPGQEDVMQSLIATMQDRLEVLGAAPDAAKKYAPMTIYIGMGAGSLMVLSVLVMALVYSRRLS